MLENLKKIILEEAKKCCPPLRKGQAVFNVTESKYGDIARQVQFEDGIDCFYDDSKIDDFISAVYKRHRLKTKELLERLHEDNMFYFVVVSLFSADTLTDLEHCNKSEELLLSMLDVIDDTNLDEEKRVEYKDSIKKGLEIVYQDKAKFTKQ